MVVAAEEEVGGVGGGVGVPGGDPGCGAAVVGGGVTGCCGGEVGIGSVGAVPQPAGQANPTALPPSPSQLAHAAHCKVARPQNWVAAQSPCSRHSYVGCGDVGGVVGGGVGGSEVGGGVGVVPHLDGHVPSMASLTDWHVQGLPFSQVKEQG